MLHSCSYIGLHPLPHKPEGKRKEKKQNVMSIPIIFGLNLMLLVVMALVESWMSAVVST